MNRKITRRAALGTIGGIAGIVPGFLGDSQYVIEDVQVDQPQGPISLEVTTLEPNIEYDSAGEIEFSVTNESDEPIELKNHGITPFGVLEMAPSQQEMGILLYTPDYENSDHIDISPNSRSLSSPVLTETIEPDETISTVYELEGSRMDGGGRFNVFAPEWLLAYRDPESGTDIEAAELVTLKIETQGLFSL